jgi:hypothetical protein
MISQFLAALKDEGRPVDIVLFVGYPASPENHAFSDSILPSRLHAPMVRPIPTRACDDNRVDRSVRHGTATGETTWFPHRAKGFSSSLSGWRCWPVRRPLSSRHLPIMTRRTHTCNRRRPARFHGSRGVSSDIIAAALRTTTISAAPAARRTANSSSARAALFGASHARRGRPRISTCRHNRPSRLRSFPSFCTTGVLRASSPLHKMKGEEAQVLSPPLLEPAHAA